ncbi:MAG: PAS domain S-box protein [Planctomycetes bacterium]|nr:PAS domain S-box protein [Planctomycetota bacterium]
MRRVPDRQSSGHSNQDAPGETTGGAGLVHESAEGDDVQAALVESERKHRLRFMEAVDAILIVDREGRYIDANPAACTLTGYSRAELTSMRIPDLSPAEDREYALARFERLKVEKVTRRERRIRCKDGTYVEVEVQAINLGDGTFQTSIRDISVRTAAEAQLSQALQQLRFHIERMPLGHIVWTPEFLVTEWNPAAERIFGFQAHEVLGKHAYECIVPRQAQPLVNETWAKILAGDMSSHATNDNVRKDGRIIRCEWFNTPLCNTEGRITGVASMVQDVTDRELAESQVRQTQKLESLGVLASGVAHDFNNLLMVISGNLTLLKGMRGLPETARERLVLIEESATKASALTHSLLMFARTGRHNPEPSDLNEIVQSAETLLRASIGAKVSLELLPGENLPQVHVDRSQTEQVVMNLCLNAAQAMPEGGTVTIETAYAELDAETISRCVPADKPKLGPRVTLAVRDHGCGIDNATRHRIFDPFFTTKPEGRGLGLPAVLGILKQHGAHLVIDSEPGAGAEFRVYFPIISPPAAGGGRAVGRKPAAEPGKHRSKRKRVSAARTTTTSKKRRSTSRKSRR